MYIKIIKQKAKTGVRDVAYIVFKSNQSTPNEWVKEVRYYRMY